ncbi:hypothetical protein KQ51_00668 [Candidatus Izimaplasma bacterium HR1]|jgi:ribosomal-protein-alanine N-acetyltransferase|uniref:GNAT family N-acetyltransferase n=1 Tax=Candidatus Izimoplasma sp. HR1 TaxID=1541959 RepID=UPI0004F85940|nr:hypothetical protein KQ51_00668 [Candidatus Izimaplasma bacterium HR1]
MIERLESDRLEFSSFKEDDYQDLLDILGNEIVCEYLPGEKVYSSGQVKSILNYFIKTFIVEKKNLHYIVKIKGSNTVIGYSGCSYIKEYDCNEIEYFLKPQFFGNKYATEIAFKMKEVAQTLGLNHLVGLADINNIPSQKVLEKIGYKFIKVVEHWGSTLRYYELNL